MDLQECVTTTNAKTIPGRHPLPRIKIILDSLGGNQYFTLLSQTKAYHQLHPPSNYQKLTAFITPWGFTNGLESHLD